MTSNERIAHDIVCVVKYGAPGGQVHSGELARMRDYLERIGLLQRPVRPAPVVKLSAPVIRLPA